MKRPEAVSDRKLFNPFVIFLIYGITLVDTTTSSLLNKYCQASKAKNARPIAMSSDTAVP